MTHRSTYTVAKVDDRRWGVRAPDETDYVHVGSFVVVWREALRLAGRSRPSLVIAVNDEGEVVAREQFDPLPPVQMRPRSHAPAGENDSVSDESPLTDGTG